MPRKRRSFEPGQFLHVMVHAVDGCELFRDQHDRARFLARIARVLAESKMRCLAWAFLGNHLHLLVQVGPVSISKVMHRLDTWQAVVFNLRHGRRGPLMWSRYKAKTVNDDDHLLGEVRYVLRNPLRHGFVTDLGALLEHPWTGIPEILGAREPVCVDVDFVLSLFGSDRSEARAALVKFLGDELADAGDPDHTSRHLPGACRDELCQRTKLDIVDRGDVAERATRAAEATALRRRRVAEAGWTFDRVVDFVCSVIGASPEGVRSGRRTSAETLARSLIVHLAVEELGWSLVRARRALGLASATASRCAVVGRQRAERLGIRLP